MIWIISFFLLLPPPPTLKNLRSCRPHPHHRPHRSPPHRRFLRPGLRNCSCRKKASGSRPRLLQDADDRIYGFELKRTGFKAGKKRCLSWKFQCFVRVCLQFSAGSDRFSYLEQSPSLPLYHCLSVILSPFSSAYLLLYSTSLSLSFCPYISNLLSNNLPVLLSRFDFGSRPEELVYALLAKNQDSLVDPRSVSASLRSTLCSTRFFHTPSSVAGNHFNPGG